MHGHLKFKFILLWEFIMMRGQLNVKKKLYSIQLVPCDFVELDSFSY